MLAVWRPENNKKNRKNSKSRVHYTENMIEIYYTIETV